MFENEDKRENEEEEERGMPPGKDDLPAAADVVGGRVYAGTSEVA